jgi:hypothetical protein
MDDDVRLVEFLRADGRVKVLINPRAIAYVTEGSGSTCFVHFVSGEAIRLKSTASALVELIGE